MNDDLLHAFVDARLSDADQQRLAELWRQDPEARATAAAWLAQREALQAAQRDVLEAPLPWPLLRAATGRQRSSLASGRLGQALAACLVLAVGVTAGWWSRGQWPSQRLDPQILAQSQPRAVAHDAMVAHAVYAPDPRRPVEIDASQQELLVRWLSKRLGQPLKAPNLQALGWQLVGGRLLPGDTAGTGAARAQFMYQDADGQRLSVYLAALQPAAAGTAPSAAKALSPRPEFHYLANAQTLSFFWADATLRYAVVANLPQDRLNAVVNEVYAQSQPASAAGPAP